MVRFWGYTPAILALGRWGQEDLELDNNLDYKARLYPKEKKGVQWPESGARAFGNNCRDHK